MGTVSRVRSCVVVTVAFMSMASPASADVRAIAVPANGRDYTVPHAAYNGHPITLKAIARGFPDMATALASRFTWDNDADGNFSDETETSAAPRQCSESAEGVTCYDLGRQIQFPAQASSRLLVFGLRIESGGEVVATASYPVFIDAMVPAQTDFAANATASADAAHYQLDVMRRVALDDALWFLHLRMVRERASDGTFVGQIPGGFSINSTFPGVRAMIANGHLPAYPPGSYNHTINPGEWTRPPAPSAAFLDRNDQRYHNDPYAETVMRAVSAILLQVDFCPVDNQVTNHEEDDGTTPIDGTNDGLGLAFNRHVFNELSFHGDALAVLAESGLAGTVAQTGDGARQGLALQVKGRPIEYIVQQMVDYLASGQLDARVGEDMGGFDFAALGINHRTGDNAARSTFGGLDAAAAMAGAGVHVPDHVRWRLSNALITNQHPDTGLARHKSIFFGCDFLGVAGLTETGYALLGAKLLGSNLFSAADATIIPGTTVTRGQARQNFDAYIAAISDRWVSSQADGCVVRGLFDNDGGTNPAPYRRTDMRGNIDAMAGVGNGLLRLSNAADYLVLGGRDWWHELTTHLVRNQHGDGHWRDEAWSIPATHVAAQHYGEIAETALAAQLLALEVPSGVLQLTIAPGSAPENAGAAAATATVSRSGGHPGAIRVLVSSSDTGEATVPASVIVPAGVSSATIPIAAVDDFVLDGTQAVTIAAASGLAVPVSAAIQIVDAGLEVDFVGASARADALEGEIERLEGELGTANGTIDTLRLEVATLLAEIARLDEALESVRGELAAARTSVSDLEERLRSANNRIAALESEIAGLRSDNIALRTENSSLVTENSSLRAQLAAAEATIASQQARIDALQEQLKQHARIVEIVQRVLALLRRFGVVIPGATPADQLARIVNAIESMPHGSRLQLFKELGRHPGNGKKK